MEVVRRQIGKKNRYCYDKDSDIFVLTFKHISNKHFLSTQKIGEENIPLRLLDYVTLKQNTVLFFTKNFEFRFLYNPKKLKLHQLPKDLYNFLKENYEKI